MLLFPSVAKTAQEEISRVCGSRMPTLDDEPSLPYIRACVKESMRWMPTAVLGVPHAVIRDDEYMGYKIPKGAGVMWNVWAIHNDPTRHPDPRRFDPDRYKGDTQTAAEAANNADPSKRDQFVFGAGRRLCQGMHIAERSLFLGISRLLWAFDFELAVDGKGDVVSPDANDLTEGLLIQPKPFAARLVPRSQEKVDAIHEEWRKMGELLDEEEQWKVLPEGLIWKEYKAAAKVS
jgi:cytochrome P450